MLSTFIVAGQEWRVGYCHFFIDDYRFERLWKSPERYVRPIKRYEGMIGPDFSTYTDMPRPMQMWNKYRSMALTQYYQRNGIDVIPTLQWSDENSLEWAFKGLPRGGVYAASTVGCIRSKRAQELFKVGIEAAMDALEPEGIIMYGNEPRLPISYNCEVYRYENDNQERVRKWEAEARQAVEQEVLEEQQVQERQAHQSTRGHSQWTWVEG